MNLMQNTAFPSNLKKNPFNAIREENVKLNSDKEPSSHLFKRFKTFVEEGDDENDFTVFNTAKDQADLVKPAKKKLFNLDMNYFVK